MTHLLTLTSLLKNMIKDPLNIPLKEMQRTNMWGREQSFHALPRHTTLPALLHVHQPDHVWVSIEASSHTHDWLLTPFPTLIFSQENGGGAETSKLLITVGSSWGPAFIQEPTQSHLIRRKDTPSPRDSKGFTSPVSGTGKIGERGRDKQLFPMISRSCSRSQGAGVRSS